MRAKLGFHGRGPALRARRCKTCHSEHLGRGADIVRLDTKSFEHRVTDYPLRGGHARVQCDGCHAAGTRYREAPTQCSDCHARKDPHEGSLGSRCDRCHADAAWKTVRFDHQATTFPLEGRHRDARCQSCHTTQRYTPTARACAPCHQRDDKHRGGLGGACQSCHTPRAWSSTTFNHARQTHFPLLGKHARVTCARCHQGERAAEDTPAACVACHERDDAHRGQFGRACEQCHTPNGWPQHTFDHDRRTRYPLRGRHRDTRCVDCHHGDLSAHRPATSCYACHRDDDVHRGREGTRCDRCHDEDSWSRDVLFDHDTTRFPLAGAHTRVPCLQCHVPSSFKGVARECVSCHERDDVHHGKLGPQCERCHDASTFRTIHRAPQ
jgi:hypothetical protein